MIIDRRTTGGRLYFCTKNDIDLYTLSQCSVVDIKIEILWLSCFVETSTFLFAIKIS